MQSRRWNWPLWAGLVLSIAAFASYFTLFVRWPATRDVPWVNLLLFLVASTLLIAGARRAFVAPATLLRKILGVLVTAVGLAIFVFFGLAVFVGMKRLPVAKGAPAVGQKAPEFTLLDSNRKAVSLAQLARSSPRGVVLIFYRGYW
jgi:hypothetical protein